MRPGLTIMAAIPALPSCPVDNIRHHSPAQCYSLVGCSLLGMVLTTCIPAWAHLAGHDCNNKVNICGTLFREDYSKTPILYNFVEMSNIWIARVDMQIQILLNIPGTSTPYTLTS